MKGRQPNNHDSLTAIKCRNKSNRKPGGRGEQVCMEGTGEVTRDGGCGGDGKHGE